MSIDWNDAPAGYDFYIISGIAPEGNGFHKLSECKTLYLDVEGFNFGVIDEELTVYKRPQIVPENNVDAIETQSDTVALNEEKDAVTVHTEAPVPMFQQMQKLCVEHNVNIEFTCKGEVYVQAEDDYTYKIKDEKQLTQLLDAVKLLASFKEE